MSSYAAAGRRSELLFLSFELFFLVVVIEVIVIVVLEVVVLEVVFIIEVVFLEFIVVLEVIVVINVVIAKIFIESIVVFVSAENGADGRRTCRAEQEQIPAVFKGKWFASQEHAGGLVVE
ncbi:MAG: hypothetical protein ACKOEO_10775 [Planctomycetaceae bacterium]